jgi:hypothetical protein
VAVSFIGGGNIPLLIPNIPLPIPNIPLLIPNIPQEGDYWE